MVSCETNTPTAAGGTCRIRCPGGALLSWPFASLAKEKKRELFGTFLHVLNNVVAVIASWPHKRRNNKQQCCIASMFSECGEGLNFREA